YFALSDAEAPIEDQPLPDDASPAALSPSYVADFDLEKDPEEDPEEDPTNYPADGGDDADDESSDDDDDANDDEEEQEAFKDDDEEEEHPALADSSVIPVDDHVPSAEDTKAFEKAESTPTPIPSPPLPLPLPPTVTSPTYAEAPLSYRASGIRLRAASPSTHHPSEIPSPPLLLPSTSHINDLLEVDIPLQKRAHFTAPTNRFEVGESSVAAAARQLRLDVATVDDTLGHLIFREVGYGIKDVWDDMVEDMKDKAPTTVEGFSQRVTDLSTTLARDTHEIYVRLEEAQDDRAL
ncbi:hypothetical protein Tco_0640360, partial [Tanacetum coccineum]